MKRKENWGTDDTRASKLMKAKRTMHTFVNEDDIKLERIKRIMEQEKEMADIRKVHEEKVIAMKEEFYTKLHMQFKKFANLFLFCFYFVFILF